MLEGIPISLELVGVDNIKEVTITLVFVYNSLGLILLFLSYIKERLILRNIVAIAYLLIGLLESFKTNCKAKVV